SERTRGGITCGNVSSPKAQRAALEFLRGSFGSHALRDSLSPAAECATGNGFRRNRRVHLLAEELADVGTERVDLLLQDGRLTGNARAQVVGVGTATETVEKVCAAAEQHIGLRSQQRGIERG